MRCCNPPIAQSWRRKREASTPFFVFSPEVRKIIYTTNGISSLNAAVRNPVAANDASLYRRRLLGDMLSYYHRVVA